MFFSAWRAQGPLFWFNFWPKIGHRKAPVGQDSESLAQAARPNSRSPAARHSVGPGLLLSLHCRVRHAPLAFPTRGLLLAGFPYSTWSFYTSPAYLQGSRAPCSSGSPPGRVHLHASRMHDVHPLQPWQTHALDKASTFLPAGAIARLFHQLTPSCKPHSCLAQLSACTAVLTLTYSPSAPPPGQLFPAKFHPQAASIPAPLQTSMTAAAWRPYKTPTATNFPSPCEQVVM